MSAIHGTIIDGQIVPDVPPPWANGTRIVLRPESERTGTDDDQGDDPESIARWLAWYDGLQPLLLTAEDEERIGRVREEQRAYELATWEERSRKLEQLFE